MKSELETEKPGKVFKKRSISSQRFDFDLIYRGPRQTLDLWRLQFQLQLQRKKSQLEFTIGVFPEYISNLNYFDSYLTLISLECNHYKIFLKNPV
jgi:hypothetical protein